MSATTTRPVRRRTARFCSAVVSGLLVLATLAGLAYVLPSLLGYERYAITGGSMSGTIEKYSVVLAKPVPVEDLRAGDVITYLPPADSGVTNLVTHRIVGEETDDAGTRHFTTQGDANPDPDPWTFSLDSGTQPVVQHAVPEVGRVVVALADRETRMLLLGVPAALIALGALVELVRALLPASAGGRRAEDDRIVPEPPDAVAAEGRHRARNRVPSITPATEPARVRA